MNLRNLNDGVVYTNSQCIGCNKCISGCSAVGANVVKKDNKLGRHMVLVDPNKCILCGHCVEECVHNARTYRDDTDDFLDALKRGEDITILVAPSLLSDYEEQYNNILGGLKHLGVNHIYNTGFGADIMVWVYMNFIHSFGLEGVISQFCPVIVNYLEKYKPELLPYLVPVQSPVMCTAIYVSDYLKNTDKLAYISPCIAGKYEMEDVNTYGKVTYSVTFDRLQERLGTVDISHYYAEDEIPYGLGALISSAGGLSDNIKPYIGYNKVLIRTSGYSNIFPYFDRYFEDCTAGGELPFLVDVLSCTNGCNFGSGTSCGVAKRNEVTFADHRAKQKAYQSGHAVTGMGYEERLSLLNKRFENFELSSFVRQYDNTRGIGKMILSEEEIESVFLSMYKDTHEDRHTDCGACGYKTCRNMAYAIGMKLNYKENCIMYSKECIRLETEKTSELLIEISRMNEELKNSAQMKSNFLANMSHEIRTPMNAVIGMAEMALRGNISSEERGYIQEIKTSGRSLLTIINDILDFSKIDSGKMEIAEVDYEVMSIINDTVNLIMMKIGEKDITLLVDADPEIPYKLHGDDIRLKQVLVNFANNAVKFTNSGIIEISMFHQRKEEGLYLNFSVKDTGIGIKEEDVEKLFNSFQQVDSKRNRNIEGTGLGLVISREFVNLMGGEIKVESTYGVGSTFSFKIPQKIVVDLPSVSIKRIGTIVTATMIESAGVNKSFAKAISKFDIENKVCASIKDLKDAADSGAEFFFIDFPFWNKEMEAFSESIKTAQFVVILNARKDNLVSSHIRKLRLPIYSLNVATILNNEEELMAGKTSLAEVFHFEAPDAQVLIVDDNLINLTVAEGLLSPLKMKIDLVTGASQAIKLIETKPYDIVLMDHMMPDIDGIEATQMIRRLEGEYFKNLPIIALTANAINDAREMFLSEGMNDFIAKPIDVSDLSAKIKRWLPPEKIQRISDDKGLSPKEAKEDKLLEIEGLNVKAGLSFSGSLELYKKVLADFYAVITKKSDLIAKYEAEEDISGYTIEVHGLKSSAKLIGAEQLSQMAAKLEKCGADKDWTTIKDETGRLLQLYKEYIPILAPYGKQEKDVGENSITASQLNEKLEAIYDALDNFEIDDATGMVEKLKSCKLDPHEINLLNDLSGAVSEMEYDDASEIVKAWQGKISNT